MRKFNRYPAEFRRARQHPEPPLPAQALRRPDDRKGRLALDSRRARRRLHRFSGLQQEEGPPTPKQPQRRTSSPKLQQTGGNQVDPNQGVSIAQQAEAQRSARRPGRSQQPATGSGLSPNNQVSLQPGMPQPGIAQPGMPQGPARSPRSSTPMASQSSVQPAVPRSAGRAGPAGQASFRVSRLAEPWSKSGQFTAACGVNRRRSEPTEPIHTPGANVIDQLLTTPRPGGLNGLGAQSASVDNSGSDSGTPVATTAATQTTAAQTIGGGIAGIASKRTRKASRFTRTKRNTTSGSSSTTSRRTLRERRRGPASPRRTDGNAATPQQQQQIQQMQQGFQQAQQQQQQPAPLARLPVPSQ